MSDLKHWGGVLAALQNDTPDGADEKQWPPHAAKSAHALRRIDEATTPEEVFQRVDEVEAVDWLNSPLLDGLKSLRLRKESEALGYAPSAAVASYLLDHGASMTPTTVYIAARKGCFEVVELLLEQDTPYALFPDALSVAAQFGHLKVVELLLNPRINVNEIGDTALLMASSRGHQKVVELLLNRGMNPNVCAGWALELAAIHGHDKIVDLLLKRGANPKFLDF
jgi:hypothetical protein